MHKRDPIERLPDGTFFRLTPGQLRSVRGLTKRCCNFLDGDCLLLDGVCPQYISRSLICRWFRRAVLPQQPKLEQAQVKLHRSRQSATRIFRELEYSGLIVRRKQGLGKPALITLNYPADAKLIAKEGEDAQA